MWCKETEANHAYYIDRRLFMPQIKWLAQCATTSQIHGWSVGFFDLGPVLGSLDHTCNLMHLNVKACCFEERN